MKTKRFLRLLCLLLVLLLALAVTAYAEETEPAGTEENPAPALTVAYKNLSYSSSIYVMYAVSYDNVAVSNDIQMLFWDAPQTNGYLYGTQTYAVTESRVEVINDRNHRIFYSNGVAPKELVDNQYCRAYIQVDGVDYYSEVLKFSPLSYIKKITEMTRSSEADRNLAAALRAYGHYAQIRLNYKLDDLALEPHYDITLTNAVLDDGFPYGLYKEGTELTLTAVIPEGDSVVRWIDGTGTVLGTDTTTLTYTLNADAAVRAVLASEPDSCDHVYSDWIAAAEPTCTEAGTVGHYHCELCGRNFDAQYAVIEDPVVIPSLGHDWVDVEALAPSCLPGHTAYRYCSRCDAQEGYEELAASEPHSYEETVVAPAGESRGYTEYTCSVCGDSYRSDYDYSLYSGVDFSTTGKYLIPQNFKEQTYTIEAAVQLSDTISSRAGVILGSYDNFNPAFNLEIYNGGKPRLFFMLSTTEKYSYIFDTDIRVDVGEVDTNDDPGDEEGETTPEETTHTPPAVKHLTFTLEPGLVKLYVDGVLAETKEIDEFVFPKIERSLMLGGDNRTGNSQAFQGTIYSVSIFGDIRTEEEIIDDLVLADSNDQHCLFSINLLSSTSINQGVVLDPVLESAQVTNAEELAYHASRGTKNIEVMNDIVLDRTVYVISEPDAAGNSPVTVFSNSDCTILRDPDFYGDMFVVGENNYGRNLLLDDISCELNLGKEGATGILTIDGNKENVTGDVFGTIVYINNAGTVNINGAVLTNNRKVANSRSLGIKQSFANQIGGAGAVIANGVLNLNSGAISNCEVNTRDLSGGDSSAENFRQSEYGGSFRRRDRQPRPLRDPGRRDRELQVVRGRRRDLHDPGLYRLADHRQ